MQNQRRVLIRKLLVIVEDHQVNSLWKHARCVLHLSASQKCTKLRRLSEIWFPHRPIFCVNKPGSCRRQNKQMADASPSLQDAASFQLSIRLSAPSATWRRFVSARMPCDRKTKPRKGVQVGFSLESRKMQTTACIYVKWANFRVVMISSKVGTGTMRFFASKFLCSCLKNTTAGSIPVSRFSLCNS